MSRLLILPAILCLALAAAACTGDSNSDSDGAQLIEAFFDPERADELARAAMPEPADLPGDGWEVVGRDDFDDDGDEEEDEFDRAFEDEPACAELNALDNLGGITGSGDDGDPPAGRAQIELSQPTAAQEIPTSVDVEIEIERTVSEISGSWGLAKDVIESPETQECMIAAMNAAFSSGEDMPAGADFEVSARSPSATAPNDGATMSFQVNMVVVGIEFDMAFEFYMFPYGNAGVTVGFVGESAAIDAALTKDVLAAVIDKLEATETGTQ